MDRIALIRRTVKLFPPGDGVMDNEGANGARGSVFGHEFRQSTSATSTSQTHPIATLFTESPVSNQQCSITMLIVCHWIRSCPRIVSLTSPLGRSSPAP
jgi:hypothetical protein